MEYQIVVARYNEDISYLSLFKDIAIIYNKGNQSIPKIFNSINLPNVGRESHTYLYHIIQNYDNIANRTLFIQGKISDHKMLPIIEYFKPNQFVGRLTRNSTQYLVNNIKHEGKYLTELLNGNMKKSRYTPYQWINKIGINISKSEEFQMVWGANFCVSKELIHRKPKEFYENIIKYVHYHINPEEGHYFERAWYLIFTNNNFKPKNNIYHIYIQHIQYNFINFINNKLLNNKNNIQEIHLWTNNVSNNIPIIYNNSNKYIQIYPDIVNNSFNIEIMDELQILIKINANIEYEINIKKNHINIVHNNEVTKNVNTNYSNKYIIYINKQNITIKDNNNKILITNNSNNIYDEINDEINNEINVYVKKSVNTFYYDYNSKIYQIYTQNNDIDLFFYEQYYNESYINNLEEFLINK